MPVISKQKCQEDGSGGFTQSPQNINSSLLLRRIIWNSTPTAFQARRSTLIDLNGRGSKKSSTSNLELGNHLRASLKTKGKEKTRVQMAGRRTSRVLSSSQQSDEHKIKVPKDKGQFSLSTP